MLGEVWADPAASPRFDLMGLTPDAPEDEAGIKKAAENSKELWGGGSGCLSLTVTGAGVFLPSLLCFCFPVIPENLFPGISGT